MWPSGPMPSITTSNSPPPMRPHRRRRTPSRRRRRRRRPRSRASRAPLAGSTGDRVEERRAGLPGVAVVGVGGHEALVAPPEDDPRPVDVASRRRAGRSRGGSSSAMVPPVRAICGTSPDGLGVGEPAQQLAGDGGRQRRRAYAWTSTRGTGSALMAPAASAAGGRWRRRRRPRRGAAAPRRAARAARRRLRATGRSGRSGEENVASVRRAARSGSVPPWSRARPR